jgi:transcriptional regulator with XRE-family HTH domain
MEGSQEPTSVKDVAERLRLTRLALKLSQVRLCEITGISKSTWNNAETADARIGLDSALLLCQATDITLDWIYRGKRGGLPGYFIDALAELERAPARRRA